jgi:hypothetical protein
MVPARVVVLELVLVGFHRGATHQVEGAMIRTCAKGNQWSSVQPKSSESVADTFFRLGNDGPDGLSQFLKRGPLIGAVRLPDTRRLFLVLLSPTLRVLVDSFFVVCLLSVLDVQFHHLEHRLHDTLGFRGILAAQQSPKTVGTICQESPYLSLSQPHCTSLPPAESFFQIRVQFHLGPQFTTNETASVKFECGRR